MMKPSTWNQFDGEPGAYDVRFVDVVSPGDAITLSTSSYTSNPTIAGLTPDASKLGAKLAAARGELIAAHVVHGVISRSVFRCHAHQMV